LYERSLFSAIRQQKEESVAQFELRLRVKADVCEFGDADRVDRVILDQPVPNLCNLELRYKLLETEDLILETALAKAKLFETLRSQVPHMGGKQQVVDNHDAPNSVNSVSGPKRKDASRGWRGRSSTNLKSDRPAIVCYACGRKGRRAKSSQCQAKEKKCFTCGKFGHFKNKCRKLSQPQPQVKPKSAGEHQASGENTAWDDAIDSQTFAFFERHDRLWSFL